MEAMGTYDFNKGSIVIPGNSVVPSLNSNRGAILVGPNCEISECNDNRGRIQFQHGLVIKTINDNIGQVSVDDGSKVDLIANNRGSIILASDCILMNSKNNFGSIVGGGKPGKSNSGSNSGAWKFSARAHSSREYSSNDRNTYNPFVANGRVFSMDGMDSMIDSMMDSMMDETFRMLFDGSIFKPFGLQSTSSSQSNSYKNKVQPSKGTNNVPIPSAPLLDADRLDRKKNCAAPDVSSSKDADQALCSICMERPKNVAFQCGHLCCANCSKKLQTCHMCRVKIDQKINLFFLKITDNAVD